MLLFVVYLALCFLALFFNSTVFSNWPTAYVRFEFIWILVLYLAFTKTLGKCGLLVICLGLIEDIGGAPFLGFFATIYFFCAVLLRTFISHMFVETLWARLLWVGIFSFLALLLEWGLLEGVSESQGLRNYLFPYVFLQSIMNMVLAAVQIPLLDRLEDFMGKKSPIPSCQ